MVQHSSAAVSNVRLVTQLIIVMTLRMAMLLNRLYIIINIFIELHKSYNYDIFGLLLPPLSARHCVEKKLTDI